MLICPFTLRGYFQPLAKPPALIASGGALLLETCLLGDYKELVFLFLEKVLENREGQFMTPSLETLKKIKCWKQSKYFAGRGGAGNWIKCKPVLIQFPAPTPAFVTTQGPKGPIQS